MSPPPIRFLIDEDTAHAIRSGLKARRPEIEIRVVGGEGAPPLSTKDEDVLEFIEREGFILVSSNRSTMPQHLRAHLQKGRHIPGILILRPGYAYGRIIDELAEWGYARVIKLYSNNEPFLDKRIFDFAEYTRAKLPEVDIKMLTNGTVLDVEKVERILPVVSSLHINNYSTDFLLHDNVQEIVDHVNKNLPDLVPKLTVTLRQMDEIMTTRGGKAPNRAGESTTYYSRCAFPFFQMVIRPDGKISMCCNDALGEVTLGDVSRQPLRDAWNSDQRREMQDAMLKGRNQIALCAKCDNMTWAHPKRIAGAIETGAFRRANK